jgi:ketosteroid isomerase-like protein
MLDDPNLKLNFSSDRIEVSASGDLATTKGSYTSTMTNPKTKKTMEDKGSYLTVYKKQADGSWKAVEDMIASEVAPN